MRFKSIQVVAIIALLSLSQVSCDIISSSGGQKSQPNPVSLTNPEVGQESRFVRFYHECFFCEILKPREFQPDTLVLEVIAVEENALVLKEYISPGSRSFSDTLHSETKGVYRPHEVFDYRVTIVGDTIKFSEYTRGLLGSWMTWLQEMSPINAEDELFVIDDWKIYSSGENNEGIAVGFSQLGNSYDTLKAFVDFSATAYDGPGFAHLYSLEEYLPLSYVYNPWTNSTQGWAKLY